MSPYYHERKSRVPGILLKSFIFVVFWLIALGTIFYTMGFEIDFRHFRLKETGTIYLATTKKKEQAELKINNQLVAHELPATLSRLRSGWYQVAINKVDYQTWRKDLEVNSSKVTVQDSIVLVKNKIEIREANETEKNLILNQRQEPLDQLINIKANELYIEDRLVTRFSHDIKQAIWYPDGQHIVYQIDKTLFMIEIDGKNEIKLIDLKNDDATAFRFMRKGQELLYQDGDKFYVARLYE